jgi:hypothetical protein
MSALILLLMVWAAGLPLAFAVTLAALPRHLNRRATSRVALAEVVDIRTARATRAPVRRAAS